MATDGLTVSGPAFLLANLPPLNASRYLFFLPIVNERDPWQRRWMVVLFAASAVPCAHADAGDLLWVACCYESAVVDFLVAVDVSVFLSTSQLFCWLHDLARVPLLSILLCCWGWYSPRHFRRPCCLLVVPAFYLRPQSWLCAFFYRHPLQL